MVHVLVVELLQGESGRSSGAGALVLLGESQKVLHEKRLAFDGEKCRIIADTLALSAHRRGRVLKPASHQGRVAASEGVGFYGRYFHELVFLADALEERGPVQLRARVFGHFAFQGRLDFGEGGYRLLFNQLDNVPAVGRLHGRGDIAGLLHLKRRFLERRNHAARAEGWQLAAVGRRAGIFRELSHELVPVFTLFEAGVQLVGLLTGRQRVIFGGVGIHAHHQVRHFYFALRRAAVVYFDNVVAEARPHWQAELAGCGFVSRCFERIHHLHGREVAQLAAVLLGRGVFADLAGEFGKIFAALQLFADFADFLVSDQRVGRCRVGSHANEDVRSIHLLAHAVVGFAHQLVGYALFRQVRLRELLAVAVQLAFEGLRGIQPFLFRFQHLEAKVGVEVQVLGYAGAGAVIGGRRVVFPVHVSELVGRYRVRAQGFDGWSAGPGGRSGQWGGSGGFAGLAGGQQHYGGRADVQKALVHKADNVNKKAPAA